MMPRKLTIANVNGSANSCGQMTEEGLSALDAKSCAFVTSVAMSAGRVKRAVQMPREVLT